MITIKDVSTPTVKSGIDVTMIIGFTTIITIFTMYVINVLPAVRHMSASEPNPISFQATVKQEFDTNMQAFKF